MKKDEEWIIEWRFEWAIGFAVCYDKDSRDWVIVIPFCVIEITSWPVKF